MRRYRMGRASLLILLLGLSLGMLIEGIALARAGAHNRTIERLLAGEDIPVSPSLGIRRQRSRSRELTGLCRGTAAMRL